MKNKSIRIARIGIIAALYITMSLAIAPLTYGLIQVRFAEMLLLLCFFDKDYCYSLTLGCLVVNAFSPLGIIDVVFGTIGTIISVIGIRFIRRIYLVWIPPVLSSFMIALEFTITASEPFWLSFGTIALGEFIAVALIGTPVFMLLSRNKRFLELIGVDSRYRRIMNTKSTNTSDNMKNNNGEE